MSIPNAIPAEWQAARRLLAIRLDNLGDVLLTTPALHALKESLPNARLTLLASPAGAQAARLNADVDDVIVHASPLIDPWRELPQNSQREQQLIAELKGQRFDGAVIFTSFRQSPLPAAYLCYLADIPLRLAACTDGAGSLLTTRHKHPARLLHEVERGLDLVGAIGCATSALDLVLDVPRQAQVALNNRLFEWRAAAALPDPSRGMQAGPLIVVHPGCSMPARTYPWQQYAEIVDLLIAQLGATVIVTGSAQERDLVGRVCARLRPEHRDAALALAGELEFAELCALIERADALITNNTGPMHVAAAVKTPVVALFALTNPPEQWEPWRVPHRLLYHDVACRICYQRTCPYGQECLRMVSPQMVADTAADLLGMRERAMGEPLVLRKRAAGEPLVLHERVALVQASEVLDPDLEPSPDAVDLESEEFGWRMGAGWRLGSR